MGYGACLGGAMNFADAVSTCLSKYATFHGRATRSEFWWFTLFTFTVGVLAQVVDQAIWSTADGVMSAIATLGLVLPSLAVGARRLHDIGRTGWWQLLALTVIGSLVLLYWFVQPSQPDPGPDAAATGV